MLFEKERISYDRVVKGLHLKSLMGSALVGFNPANYDIFLILFTGERTISQVSQFRIF